MIAFALLVTVGIGVASGHNDVLARYECTRCHVAPATPPATFAKSCVDCHVAIEAGTVAAKLGKVALADDVLAKWRARVVHYLDVPSLASLDGRVRRTWVERFVLDPHRTDVRPGLSESMPRLPITREDARAIAKVLVPHEPDERPLDVVAVGSAARLDGRKLFDDKACAQCHAFIADDVNHEQPLARIAPNLRHARERMTPRSIVAWLVNPPSTSRMPRIPMTQDEATALARFVVEEPLPPPKSQSRPAPPPPLPLLQRRVAWDEVYERVFSRSCRHCHADPALAFGDGGPGNTGGFGYRARGLSLASYAETNEGALIDNFDGERRSIFAPLDDGPFAGTPRIVAHLLARRAEERGDTITGVIGMPLGLPSVDDEQLQLLESWIAQGRPR